MRHILQKFNDLNAIKIFHQGMLEEIRLLSRYWLEYKEPIPSKLSNVKILDELKQPLMKFKDKVGSQTSHDSRLPKVRYLS
jgi:hypothetical protein